MDNKLISLSSLFEKRLFRIPDYQRGYAWQKDQLDDFWDDLNNLQDNHYHYTGLLSLKILNDNDCPAWGNDVWLRRNEYKLCHVVDGQQRLTTFVILLNELIHYFCGLKENLSQNEDQIYLGNDCEDTIKRIRNKYICKTNHKDNITTYLFGYEPDNADNPNNQYLRYEVFRQPNPPQITETYYTKNLKVAKNYFDKRLDALFAEEGVPGLENIYNKLTHRLMFNLHEIDDDYDVYVAFETMNNRGKKLTNLEILKNRLIYLTTIYDEHTLSNEGKAELRHKINEAWREVYRQLGRNSKKLLRDDDFLRAHWIIYYMYSRKKGDDYIQFLLNKFSSKNIFEKKAIADASEQPTLIEQTNFDEDINEDDDVSAETVDVNANMATSQKLKHEEIAAYVDSLKGLARYWYDTHFPNESPTLSEREKLWIDRLHRIDMGFFRPLVVVALCKCTNENDKVALFTAIERFIFVRFKLDNNRSDHKKSVYYKFARDLYKGNTSVQSIIDDLNHSVDENIQSAIDGFYLKMEKKFKSDNGYYGWGSIRYFLYEYEFSLSESTGVRRPSWEMFTRSEDDMVSIEHILPQTYTNTYWQDHFRPFIQDKQKMAYLTGALGNLLPLAQSINSSLQNDSFDDKKNGANRRERGYRNGSNSEIDVAKEDAWDGQRIYQRSLRLLNFMEKRWRIIMTQKQKEKLTFFSFVNDGRYI